MCVCVSARCFERTYERSGVWFFFGEKVVILSNFDASVDFIVRYRYFISYFLMEQFVGYISSKCHSLSVFISHRVQGRCF